MNPRRAIGVQGNNQARNRGGAKSDRQMLWVMLTSTATSAWLIYDMATATQAPRQTVALLQYCLLACVLFALISAVIMRALRE
jgi:cell division protein FtsW (lipid II flippase)